MTIALLGVIAAILATAVLVFQTARGRFFSLLTFYSALFLLESVGGTVKSLLPDLFSDFVLPGLENPFPFIAEALAINTAGYVVFLYGYWIASILVHRRAPGRDRAAEAFLTRWWTPSYSLLLTGLTLAAISAGLIQHWARVRGAGGLSAFLSTAYSHRFGTGTESAGETIVVVLANLVASTAVPLVLLWLIAWLRGRLTTAEKVVATSLLLFLLLRQWSTMFRTVVLFTLVSLVATYASERKVRLTRWVLVGVLILAVLIGVNFMHYYLYYLTAGWEQPRIADSFSQLLTPHGHIYTLAIVVGRTHTTAQRLGGAGFLESLFFFIPRAVWHSKADTDASGTLLIQDWAGLPTNYQMAITAVGEWIAHFGLIGVLGMSLFGALYGVLDGLAERGPVARVFLYGFLLSRVLSDSGMGLGAIAITLFCLAIYVGEILTLNGVTLFWRSVVIAGKRTFGRNRRAAARQGPGLPGVPDMTPRRSL